MRTGASRSGGRLQSERMLLVGAVALGAALRFTALDARGWWRDEAVTVRLLRLPFDELLRAIPDSEGTPPLYYVLAWGWTRLFGDSEAGLRSLSALLGTITVLVVYLAGRELLSSRVGLFAAYFAAASPLLVWHAQDGRSYSLLVLVSALSFLFFVRLRRTAARMDALWFGLASALALLTHYFAVFLVLPESVWLLADRRTRRVAAPAVAGVAAVGVALVPLALAQRGNVSWISDVPRYRRLLEILQEFLVGPQAPWERPTTVLAGALAAAALAVLIGRAFSEIWPRIRAAVVIGLAALALPVVLSLGGLDYVLARNVIVASVPLTIVVAAGLGAERAGRAGVVLAAALVALGVGVVVATADDPKFGAEDWRGVARALGPAPAGGQAIVLWPDVGIEPFLIYRPGASRIARDGAVVSQVAVATLGRRRRDDDVLDALSPPTPPFRQLERRDGPHFTLLRYDAARPTRVSEDTIVIGEPRGALPAVLVDR